MDIQDYYYSKKSSSCHTEHPLLPSNQIIPEKFIAKRFSKLVEKCCYPADLLLKKLVKVTKDRKGK